MPFVNINSIPSMKVDKPFERTLKLIMSPETDADVEGFTFIVSELAPLGGCTDFHAHDTSGELMIFLSGMGNAWMGDDKFEILPGTSMYAPPGVAHRTLNTGTEPLKIACVFVPPIDTDYIQANIRAAEKA